MPDLRPARRNTRAATRRRGPFRAAALLLILAAVLAALAFLWPGPDRGPFAEWLWGSSTTATTLNSVDLQPSSIPGWDDTTANGQSGDGTAADPSSTAASSPSASSTTLPTTTAPTTAIAASTPTRIVIPAIDVNVRVVSVGLLPDGAMEVPDFGLAGWYEPGPMPGEPGPAVVAGHVDSRSGPDVFYRLRDLQAGDEIRMVGENGVVAVFGVESREQAPKSELPVDRIWNDTDEPVIRLITCGGEFDYDTRHYRDNIIVYGSFLRTGT